MLKSADFEKVDMNLNESFSILIYMSFSIMKIKLVRCSSSKNENRRVENIPLKFFEICEEPQNVIFD